MHAIGDYAVFCTLICAMFPFVENVEFLQKCVDKMFLGASLFIQVP